MQFRILSSLSEHSPLVIAGRAEDGDVVQFTIAENGHSTVRANRAITSAEAHRTRQMFRDILIQLPQLPLLRTVVRDDDETTLAIFLMSSWNNDGIWRKLVKHEDGTFSDGVILSFEGQPEESANSEVRNGTLQQPEAETETEDGPRIDAAERSDPDASRPLLLMRLQSLGNPTFGQFRMGEQPQFPGPDVLPQEAQALPGTGAPAQEFPGVNPILLNPALRKSKVGG